MNRIHDNDVRSISKLTAQTKIHQFVSWMVLVVCVCVCVQDWLVKICFSHASVIGGGNHM